MFSIREDINHYSFMLQSLHSFRSPLLDERVAQTLEGSSDVIQPPSGVMARAGHAAAAVAWPHVVVAARLSGRIAS